MPQLLCTVRDCHAPLERRDRVFVCPLGHSFDIARSGYVNLLQPQERRAPVPGDNPEAVAARRRFLDTGKAAPLLDAIRELVTGDAILDVGCGEGYYLGSMGRGSGVDISTVAIELAARRYRRCEWVVANADRFVPYAGASFDTVMSITGRLNPSEFRRVLRDDGRLLVGIAAPDDLIELRGRGRDRLKRTVEMFAEWFAVASQQRVTAAAEVDEPAVRDLRSAIYRPRGETRVARLTLSLDLLLFTPRRASQP